MRQSRFTANPFTRTATGVFGELLIPADNAVPAVEGDCNVIFAANNERAPQKISIMGRVSGAAEATANIILKWYCFHPVAQQFYTAATLQIVGSAGITESLGNIWVIKHNPQCQKGYVQAINIKAAQALNVIVDVVEV